jgi:hypothetical protein
VPSCAVSRQRFDFVWLVKKFRGEIMQRLSFSALIRMWGISALIVIGLLVNATTTNALGHGQDMQNMPGMKMPKSKLTATRKATPKKRRVARKRRLTKKHDMSNMPGMDMPGMKMPATHRRRAASRRKKAPAQKTPANKNQMGNMPGMNMPAQPSSSPKESATPQSSPMQMNMPGMQMPSASPNPQASPQQKMDMPMPAASPSPGEMSGMKGMEGMPGMNSMNTSPLLVMSGNDMAVRVGDSDVNLMECGQMGSGTAWAPASSQLHMWDKLTGNWVLMFHFNAVAGVNSQGGPRGVTEFESSNWFMPMAFHKLGKGTLQLRGMFSLEPITFARGGSPLLFQTGETYKGQPIVDKQHPHDLWMELSAQYTRSLGERGTWFTYFGYPGEPALGPPAFMHRESASENPSATLAHHLQDSTHISFGVLTTGFTYRWFKLEGSVFNGREPDENRYNFEAHTWNSRSARFSFAPNNNWTMQVSYGFLRKPEASEPTTDIRRATASIQYNKPINRGNWATSLIWGRNHTSSPGDLHNLNGYTAESTVNFLDKNYLYTRLELVDKNELLRPADRTLLGIKDDHPSFRIGAYTFGGARDIWNSDKLSLAIGSDLTFYSKPPILDRIYGNNPVSWRLFVRLRPSKMDMSRMKGMGNPKPGEENMPPKP